MNMFDEARTMRDIIKMRGLTQNEAAKMFGISQSYVANKIRLLSLSAKAQKRILECGLSERHARCLLRLKNESDLELAIEKIHKMKLTVSESEALVDNMLTRTLPKKISKDDEREGRELFLSVLKEAYHNLKGLGIKAELYESSYGNKSYITVAIDEVI